MKIITIVSLMITLLLLLSAMICGFWLKAGNPGSSSFHVTCGIAAAVFCCITLILVVIR